MYKMLCSSEIFFVSVFLVLFSFINFPNEVGAARSRVPKEKLPKGPPIYDVKLYTMKQFEGKMVKLKVEENTCVNLPSSFEKQVASVDPSGCVILYADQDCRGFRKRLDKWSFGSTNLKDIAFESKLSSISTCPTVRKPGNFVKNIFWRRVKHLRVIGRRKCAEFSCTRCNQMGTVLNNFTPHY